MGVPETREAAVDFYRSFVRANRLFFDIGANLGNRAELFLEADCRVVCVEPQPDCADELRRRFGDRIDLVEAAIGTGEGRAQPRVATYHTLASLSTEWIDEVRASGRFSEFEWPSTIDVCLTTLDKLIAEYGMPDFCKVEVEGYEFEMIRGPSQPIGALSFEFTAERFDSRVAAARRLDSLGMTEFNYSAGESLELGFGEWISLDEPEAFLESLAHSALMSFGDVYARLPLPSALS
jgi:FkbM family methyltransferase